MRDSEFEQYESVDVTMDKEKIVMIVMPDPNAAPWFEQRHWKSTRRHRLPR